MMLMMTPENTMSATWEQIHQLENLKEIASLSLRQMFHPALPLLSSVFFRNALPQPKRVPVLPKSVPHTPRPPWPRQMPRGSSRFHERMKAFSPHWYLLLHSFSPCSSFQRHFQLWQSLLLSSLCLRCALFHIQELGHLHTSWALGCFRKDCWEL